MSDRFFVESPIENDRAALSGSEAHHLAHVMRAAVGDVVTLFDGSGAEFSARVEKICRSTVELAVLSRVEVDREASLRVVLGVALPKGDRQKWLVEKAVELGISQLVPLATERGMAQPETKALDRLRRSVIEASKQCGRNRLMEVALAAAWEDFVVQAPPSASKWIAHPAASAAPVATIVPASSTEAYLAIGPEGGFADAEVAAAISHGWHPVSLGPRILRVETAAMALAAMAILGTGSPDIQR